MKLSTETKAIILSVLMLAAIIAMFVWPDKKREPWRDNGTTWPLGSMEGR